MLISFAVTNFRSIRERVELDMIKSSLKGNVSNYFKAPHNKQLLKSAVLFGPNASGKSSFLWALRALDYLVDLSSSFKPGKPIAPYEPHRLEKQHADKPVVFEISFLGAGVQYDYKVSFDKNSILQEELHFYPSGSRSLLYHRQAGQETKFGDAYRGPKKQLEKLLLPNQLLLSKAAENNVEILSVPYHFFAKQIWVYPFMDEMHESNLKQLYARRLAKEYNSSFFKRFNSLICALDTGILGVESEKVDWSKYEFPSNMPDEVRRKIQEDYQYDIKTRHPLFEGEKQVGFEKFDVDDESTGTKSLFVIGGIILDALEHGRTLIVDEFEKNLHPAITQYLIQLFHNKVTNPRNAQLVFATHDITQLSNDSFRRDQVWFTEKNEFGVTSLYRCSDIPGIRLNTPLDKWYASGRFGATPLIHDTDFLIAMQEDSYEED